MAAAKITDVQTFLTQPERAGLLVVKVLTDQDGLYGLGCATFTWRILSVQTCIEAYLKPFLIGKSPADIEDIWQTSMVHGYWRNGPVLNNAVSGIDMALWDIKGKMAGMPCYELWGGKSRTAVPVYIHANGRDKESLAEEVHKYKEQGFRYIRTQIGDYPGIGGYRVGQPVGTAPGQYFELREKLRLIPELFDYLRKTFGDEIELIYDVHERMAPVDAVYLAKTLEEYRLFFLEDIFAPEDNEWFRHARAQCATPLAMGELFTNPAEVLPLVTGRLIDFLRLHVSDYGGVTPALKASYLCDHFGIRTAWHGPNDISPVGMAANVHLDMHLHNFGIQEWFFRSELEREMFPGTPEIRNGHAYVTEKPGWGIDLDEALAAKHPLREGPIEWTVSRLPDGSSWRP